MLQEQQIINDCKLGKLNGVIELDDCFYIPLRVTGTGDTVRLDDNGEPYIEERLKSHYFTPEVLNACSHLPITMEHPKGGLLNSETLDNAKIVGVTIHAWIQGEEIWALGKIFDKRILEQLGNKIGSTSPGFGVFCYIISSGEKIAEIPSDINHLALVTRGHWDQKKGSIGFDNSKILKGERMEEKKPSGTAMELNDVIESPKGVIEKAQFDALTSRMDEMNDKLAKFDEMNDKLDSLSKRLDEEGEEKMKDVEIDEAEEILDSGETPKEEVDEETEILDSDVQPLPIDEEFGPEHHEQPSEPKVDEDTEIIESDSVEQLDAEREELLDNMRETCDKAHPSLGVKMPHITMRETPRSIVSKFMSRNPQFVEAKYSGLRIDSMHDDLAKDVYESMKQNISKKSAELGAKKVYGFADTARGYAVDSSF